MCENSCLWHAGSSGPEGPPGERGFPGIPGRIGKREERGEQEDVQNDQECYCKQIYKLILHVTETEHCLICMVFLKVDL
jgi:hypothetical protein